MKTNIHRVKEITKSKITKRWLDDGSASYCMTITITYNDLSDCKGLKGDKTMFGEVEVVTRLTLFAQTREALKLKAEALS